jgi:DNA/RNA-binding domain of Phe-tRNA-synthetase-like protein
MEFRVAEECLRLGLRSGAIWFRGVRIEPASAELRQAIAAEAQATRTKFSDVAAIRSLPEVVAFQELLRCVGVNPRKLQPSLERLLWLAHKRGDLPAINNLVDAYNLVSVRRLLSLGAHDVDRLAPPVSLRLMTGDESFTPLGQTAPEPVVRGEYGYVDDAKRVFCRLDVLQADFSKVTTGTTSALLIVEGTHRHEPGVIDRAMHEVMALVTQHCGGTAEIIAIP